MRTNPKSGSIVPRVPRRGTTRSKPKETTESQLASIKGAPTQEEIAKLAYSLWQMREGNGGSADEDWYRAEQEIQAGSKI